MKKLTLEITYDDSNGYKGHGDSTPELIKTVVENELRVSLELDGVIKSGWKVVVVEAESDNLDSWENKTICMEDLKEWLKKRIEQEQEKYESSVDVVDKASKGGKKKAYSEVLEYVIQHEKNKI